MSYLTGWGREAIRVSVSFTVPAFTYFFGLATR